MNRNENHIKVISAFTVGIVVGALAGTVTALLTSPQSGEDNRKYIVEKANETFDTIQSSTNETFDALKKKVRK